MQLLTSVAANPDEVRNPAVSATRAIFILDECCGFRFRFFLKMDLYCGDLGASGSTGQLMRR